jgi:dihydrosphingosine 1-phosphate phosphatase
VMLICYRLVHILATGVFFTGFIKDMLSLPRPLSPPLHRITMSGSAALEYGFPSTHSANAVSVAVYALFSLNSPDSTIQPTTKLILEILTYGYACSITLGRLYCGMHGFVDVVIGSILGALLSVIECVYGPAMDNYLYSSTWRVPCIVALVILVLVRIHPEPADDCPCFDDSVAFAGVMIGVELGGWHYAMSGRAWDHPVPATVPFDLALMGWVTVILRVLVGVLLIFAWRGLMKPTLLKCLPHLFRIIEKFGLILPRKFFKPASQYQQIPSHLRVDNVMPSVSDLPSLIASIRHPRRARSVSIGPQSAADAYETLAYRDKRRRESISSNPATSPSFPVNLDMDQRRKTSSVGQNENDSLNHSAVSGVSPMVRMNGASSLPTPALSKVGTYEQMMGQGHVIYNSSTPGPGSIDSNEDGDVGFLIGQENELGEKEMFSRLEKPRVRYDVEVVTKLVVYTGMRLLITMPLKFCG